MAKGQLIQGANTINGYLAPGTYIGSVGSDGNGAFVTLVQIDGVTPATIQNLGGNSNSAGGVNVAIPTGSTVTTALASCATQFIEVTNVGYGIIDVSITQAGWPAGPIGGGNAL